MLTVKQVAERLTVSEALVYGWVQSGALPSFRFGQAGRRGSIRIAEADLETFLAAQKTSPKESVPPVTRKPAIVLKHLKLKS